MKFKYIGIGKLTEVFGHTFPKDESVTVNDEYAIRKLSNHPLFEAVADIGIPTEVPTPAPEVKKRGRKAKQ